MLRSLRMIQKFFDTPDEVLEGIVGDTSEEMPKPLSVNVPVQQAVVESALAMPRRGP